MRSRRDAGAGASIWVSTLVVLALYATAVCAMHVLVIGRIVSPPALSVALAIIAIHLVFVAVLLAGLVAAKRVSAARERAVIRWLPLVRERMVAHLLGDDAAPELRKLTARSPAAVERAARDLLASISGPELARMSQLSEALGLVELWRIRARRGNVERRRAAIADLARLTLPRADGLLREALDDPEDSIRLEAARALLRSNRLEDVERIFDFATREAPFLRSILVEELRPHALTLSEQAIPRVLASGRPGRVRAALEMIEAWQKGVPAYGVAALLRHPRAALRAQALRVLPYAAAELDVEREVMLALEDESAEVRVAAARVAGRLALEGLVGALERRLRDTDRPAALAAAYALAEIGGAGWAALEDSVRQGDRAAAPPAGEALERVRTNRLHLARV